MRRRGARRDPASGLRRGPRPQGPAADWRTVETPHFRVHYPAPFEAWALHAAGEIEAIHARVTEFIGYVPPRRIEVVVADPAGDANGEAIPYLDRPEVVLWTSPPESESSIGDYGDWMELVSTHEIAHVAHLTRPRNRSAGVLILLSPAPFGPLALRSPRWVTEGYATLVEGALTGSGRPNSSFRAMVLRQLGIEGKLPSYGALDATGTWLGGSVAYLVGSAYLEWLSEREGPEALPRLWKRMASSRGGSFKTAFRGVFGESPQTLYDRFRAELTARALEEEKRLKAAGPRRGGVVAAAFRRDSRGGGVARRNETPRAAGSLAERDVSRDLAGGRDRRRTSGRGGPAQGRRGARRGPERGRRPAGDAGPARAPVDASAVGRLLGVGSAMDARRPRRALFAARSRRRRRPALGPLPVELRARGRRARDPIGRREGRRSGAGRRLGGRGARAVRRVGPRARGPRDGCDAGDPRGAAGRRGVARLEPSARVAGRKADRGAPARGAPVASRDAAGQRGRGPRDRAVRPARVGAGVERGRVPALRDERRLGNLERRSGGSRRERSAGAAHAGDRRRVRPGARAGRKDALLSRV